MKKVVVTGCAGFIGFHVVSRLLDEGCRVVGIDRLDDYYDLSLKEDRLKTLQALSGFDFRRIDLATPGALEKLDLEGGDAFIHLAAQPGVRYSIEEPRSYVQSNLVAFLEVLEWCRKLRCPHLVYASSSSVYGCETTMPYLESSAADHPKSFYGATKRCNELMAHSYADLYGLPVTGLRFFTVYGPWGRPDMAPFIFTKKILAGEAIEVFNHGNLSRDFTYIDDIVEGIFRVAFRPPIPDLSFDEASPQSGTSYAPYRVYNIGQGNPSSVMEFVEILERCLGRSTSKVFLPMQPGDVYATFASTSALQRDFGYQPQVGLVEGVTRFAEWYRDYYGV